MKWANQWPPQILKHTTASAKRTAQKMMSNVARNCLLSEQCPKRAASECHKQRLSEGPSTACREHRWLCRVGRSRYFQETAAVAGKVRPWCNPSRKYQSANCSLSTATVPRVPGTCTSWSRFSQEEITTFGEIVRMTQKACELPLHINIKPCDDAGKNPSWHAAQCSIDQLANAVR